MKIQRNIKGFSIVEAMLAIVLGLIVLTGLVTVFDTTSNMNRTQNGLARLQENGRFAIMHMKQNIEQASYQFCLGTNTDKIISNTVPAKLPWLIYSGASLLGIPSRASTVMTPSTPAAPAPYLFDPSHMIYGNECSSSSCFPSTQPAGVPSPGTGDGDRIIGTDILTFRYIRGNGRDVSSIGSNDAATNTQTVTFTMRDQANNTTVPTTGSEVLLIRCDGSNQPPALITVVGGSPGSAIVSADNTFPLPTAGAGSLTRMFSFTEDVANITYYVANNVINSRDTPTLYVINNGVTSALIEGVDRFDLIYGVKLANGSVQYFDAAGVQALSGGSCSPEPFARINNNTIALTNPVGCAWRDVISVEVSLLLNTVRNSSADASESYKYSPDGDDWYTPSDLPSGIGHYNMNRKEFFYSIALKNKL